MFSSLKLSNLRNRTKSIGSSVGKDCSLSSSKNHGCGRIRLQKDQVLCTSTPSLTSKPPRTPISNNRRISKCSENSLAVSTRITSICIQKENGNLGFTLRGGTHHDPMLSRPIVVTNVKPGGPIDREGSIKPGDRLVAVNGTSLHAMNLSECHLILQQSDELFTTLTIEYDVSILETVRHANGPLLIEIHRPVSRDLGVTFVDKVFCREIGPRVVIGGIKPASIADRCGALHVGDIILAVGEFRLEGQNIPSSKVNDLINSSAGQQLALEILPYSQTFQEWRNLDSYNIGNIPHNCYPSPTPSPVGFSSFNFRSYPGNRMDNGVHYPVSDLGSNSSCNGVNHRENLHIILQSDRGYGFSVQATESEAILISKIDPGGPAERSGCLQVGDRIVSANHFSVNDMLKIEDVKRLITEAESSNNMFISLQVEFDVADSVVPSSGIFSVKLAKRGCGLGITITAPKTSSPGDALIISEIRCGSVAHRTGTLAPGDRLLAINNIPLDEYSLEMTQQILQESDDIVTLRVQKGLSITEVADNKTVVYTVELLRNDEPLGITISGSEDPHHPITISGLTNGGLAEQTGALHIGDHLLAINGEILIGKSLIEVAEKLQNPGNSVNLKVRRRVDKPLSICGSPDLSHGQFAPALPSVDSAVESWDSSTIDASNLPSPDVSQSVTEVYKAESSTVKRKLKVSLEADTDSPNIPNWENTSQSSHSLDSEHSIALSEDGTEDEHAISEDLQKAAKVDDMMMSQNNVTNNVPESCETLTAQPSSFYWSDYPPPSPLCMTQYHWRGYQDIEKQDGYIANNWSGGSYSYRGSYTHLATGVQLYQITLFKDPIYEDFGFSVSDGLYERGVYINRIRKGGPADLSSVLQPYDRILQVNDTVTDDFDCCLTVPLIASAGERLQLTIARNTTVEHKSSDKFLPWVDEEANQCSSPVTSFHSTITKTL